MLVLTALYVSKRSDARSFVRITFSMSICHLQFFSHFFSSSFLSPPFVVSSNNIVCCLQIFVGGGTRCRSAVVVNGAFLNGFVPTLLSDADVVTLSYLRRWANIVFSNNEKSRVCAQATPLFAHRFYAFRGCRT